MRSSFSTVNTHNQTHLAAALMHYSLQLSWTTLASKKVHTAESLSLEEDARLQHAAGVSREPSGTSHEAKPFLLIPDPSATFDPSEGEAVKTASKSSWVEAEGGVHTRQQEDTRRRRGATSEVNQPGGTGSQRAEESLPPRSGKTNKQGCN